MKQQLKYRLVGATVLVLLGVIFIPMILSPPEKTDKMFVNVISPPKSAGGFNSRVTPTAESEEVPEKRNVRPETQQAPKTRYEPASSVVAKYPTIEPTPITPPAKEAKKITKTEPAQPTITKRSETREKTPAPKAATPRTTSSTKVAKSPAQNRQQAAAPTPKPTNPRQPKFAAWAVQVGSFTDQKNALGLRDRLRAKGYHSFVKSIRGKGTNTTRVFVGPKLRRDDALRTAKKLRRDLKIKGLVVRYSGGR